MNRRIFDRGIFPPVLFSLLFTVIARASATPTLYATLGPEAPSILRVLIGDHGFVAVEPGHLAAMLKQHSISTLIVPLDWADETDLDSARAAGLSIVNVQRHNSIFNIEANIRALAALTGTIPAGM